MERLLLSTASDRRTNPKSQSFRDLLRAITNQEISDIQGIPRTKRAMIMQSLVDIAVHGTVVLPYSREMAILSTVQGEVPSPRLVTASTEQWLSVIKFVTEFLEGKTPPVTTELPGEGETEVTFETWKKTVQFRRRSAQGVGQVSSSQSLEEEWVREESYEETSS